MSLITCIKKAGKALTQSDADAIREIQQELLADGLTATEAAKKAIDEHLSLLQQEREDMLSQLRKKNVNPADIGDIRFSRRSRAGRLTKYKSGPMAGQFRGAPAGEKDLRGLMTRLGNLAKEGEYGRFWYEESGDAILHAVGGDPVAASQLAGLLANFSPGTAVAANTTMAVKAWNQWKAGQPIDVSTGDRNEKAMAWLNDGAMPDGEKVQNFYNNLMRRILRDPHFGMTEDEIARDQGVTVDVWMLRAFGFFSDRTSSEGGAQYKFAQEITQRLADKLGWEPQQVQAAIWVAMKVRQDKVRKPVKAAALKAGVAVMNGKDFKVVDKAGYNELMYRAAMAVGAQEASNSARGFDVHLKNHVAQLSWEATPSVDTEELSGIHGAPLQQRVEHQLATSMALTDERGNDLLALKLGLLQNGAIDGPAAWADVIGHGGQTVVLAPPSGHGDTTHTSPETRTLLNVYSAVLGYVLKQDAVAWHRPFFGATKRDSNGVHMELGRPLTHAEAQAVYKAMIEMGQRAGLSYDEAKTLAPIHTDTGFRVIKNAKFTHLSNGEFHGIVMDATAALQGEGTADPHLFAADTEIVSNDWKENTNGESFRSRVIDAGFEHILGWAEGVLAPRVRATNQRFAQQYGWGAAEERQGEQAGQHRQVATPVSLDRLAPGATETQKEIYGRFGDVDHSRDTTKDLKFYNLDTLVKSPGLISRFLAHYGFKAETFSFVDDPKAGVKVRIPQLKRGYDSGTLWIYDPRVAAGSFKDETYTRAWRVTHEAGHGITEPLMQSRYGDSRRYGRLGRTMVGERGADRKVSVDLPALTLKQAQRAVEWEDVAFRAQRLLLEELGVTISDAEFAQEYNTNISDATYRVLTGGFGDPGEYGFKPNQVRPNLREALRLLENSEKILAAEQGRNPTQGINLTSWKPITDQQIRDAVSDWAKAHGSKGDEIRFSLRPDHVNQINADPTHPDSIYHKLTATVEYQMGDGQRSRRGVLDAIKDQWENKKTSVLAAVPLNAIRDFARSSNMPSVDTWVRTIRRMTGRENELTNQRYGVLKPWISLQRRDPAEGASLAAVMHHATLSQVDPARDFEPRVNEGMLNRRDKLTEDLAQGRGNALAKSKQLKTIDDAIELDRARKAAYMVLRRSYNALSTEGKRIYQEVRDLNAEQWETYQHALIDRIQKSEGADDATKSHVIQRVRQEFEAGKVDPYFSLGRFGPHWSLVRDPSIVDAKGRPVGPVISFAKFENPSDQQQFAQQWLEQKGVDPSWITEGKDINSAENNFSRVDPAFAANVAELVKGLPNDQGVQLADDIWQMYIKRLPEMSARKHFLHRKNIAGFTGDAMRAFADNTFHMARQITKAEFGYKLEKLVAAIRKEAQTQRAAHRDYWANDIASEVERRHQWVMEPRSGSFANNMVAFGTHLFLGLNPSSAATNLTQTWIMGLPVLASRNDGNFAGAAAALLKASSERFTSSREGMSEVERAAFDEFDRIGLFDRTRASELIATAEKGTNITSRWHDAGQISMWLFQRAEQFNREVTALAAFRMAYERLDGSTPASAKGEELARTAQITAKAILEAEDVTWETHFDYSNKNRPRIMQGNTARIILLFRNYAANITYRLARDLADATRGETPAIRREARVRATGMWGMTMLFAGAGGLPFIWALANIWGYVFGSKDKPVMPKEAMRRYMADDMGLGAHTANMIMDGPMDSLTGTNLSNRVSLANLWFMDHDTDLLANPKDWATTYATDSLGPLASYAGNVVTGAQIGLEGNWERGFEKLLPAEGANLAKMYRYMMEGFKTISGDQVMGKDELSGGDYFKQALGFTPRSVDLSYKTNAARKEVVNFEKARKDILRANLENALRQKAGGRPAAFKSPEEAAALSAIRTFNMAHRDDPLDPGPVYRATYDRREYLDGVRTPHRLMRSVKQFNFNESP